MGPREKPEATGRQRQGHGRTSAGDAGQVLSHTLRTVPWVARGYIEGMMLQKTCGSTGYPVTPTKTNEYLLKNDGTRRLFCLEKVTC